MRVHQLPYRDDKQLIEWIDGRDIRDSEQLLIQIYTYSVDKIFIANLIALLNPIFPQATLTLVLSVNVSNHQFQRNDFVEVVQEVLHETGLKPEWLHLEITESTALINLEHTRLILQRLRTLGVSISMDDFGTGYSSLSCVKDLSMDKLKIDRSFITNISTDERDAAIVKTIIALSRNLNMKVLAEGVESKEQLDKLAEYECALPADKFEELFFGFG